MRFAMKQQWKKVVGVLLAWGLIGLAAPEPAISKEAVLPRAQLNLLQEEMVANGVRHFTYQGTLADGETMMVQVIEADLLNPEVKVKPVAATPGSYGKRESVSSIGTRTGGVAAVNGGFYSTSAPYLPVGSLVLDGELETSSDMFRVSLGWLENGVVRFGYFHPQRYLEFEDGRRLPVEILNQEATGKGIALYTSEWGEVVGSGEDTVWASLIPLEDGSYQVVERSLGRTTIPVGGLAASLPEEGSGRRELMPGKVVRLKLEYDPYWQGLQHLLTGGPLLVEEGRPVFQYTLEGYSGNLEARHPRTAVGVTGDGKMLLVTVDGRQPGVSVGVTFDELAFLMVDLGADRAMGLDGGGSTTAWVNGQVVNQPSEGNQRLVANGLVVRSGIAVFIDGKRIYFDVSPRLEAGRTLVPLRAFFEGLGATVDWQEGTQTVLATKGDTEIRLPVGSPEAMVNGEIMVLDVPAKVEEGRTLVPLRFVGEALGAEVSWDPDKIITINSAGEVSQ